MIRSTLTIGAVITTALLAFSRPSQSADPLDLTIGRALFERPWVAAPSRTRANDGLGPLYVARACVSCHPGGGQGRLPPQTGMVARLADDPLFGRQLQTSAVAGFAAEGRFELGFQTVVNRLPDGTTVNTRRPLPVITSDPAQGAVTVAMSLRLAPPLWGLGALERVPVAALADLERSGPTLGVSGRLSAGRFGWKADQPSLAAQTAAAFLLDIGLSTPLHPEPWGDCTPRQVACRAAIHGDDPSDAGAELTNIILDPLNAHVAAVAPPPPPKADPPAEGLFAETGCAACHTPRLPLDDGATIQPYSDLLLHDMGPDLADGVVGVTAEGPEWRTPPLWGMSRRLAKPDEVALLHDGRARSVEEAILWHGGEAAGARDRFTRLDAAARARLVRHIASF